MAPTSNQRNNRIEIDLKVLQDENVRKLEAFGTSFVQAVNSLVTAIGNLTNIAGGTGGPGNLYASEAKPETAASQRADIAGQQMHVAWNKDGIQSYNFASEVPMAEVPKVQSIATPAGRPPPGLVASMGTPAPEERLPRRVRYSFGDINPNMTDYEKAQFRLGELNPESPVSVLQYLSHVSGNFGNTPYIGPAATALSGAFGGGARATSYISGIYSSAAPKFGLPGLGALTPSGSIGIQQFGVNTGANAQGGSLSGLQGLPVIGGIANLASPAGFKSLKASIQAAYDSQFGATGNMTLPQAEDIKNTLANYGWMDTYGNKNEASPELDMLKNVMYKYTKKYKGLVTPDEMMNMGYDASARFGTSSIKDLNQALNDLTPTAKAAHMSITELVAALIPAAQEVSQATGSPMSTSILGLQAFTAATGLSPTIGANITSKKSNIWAGLAITGTQPWQLVEGKKSTTTMAMAGMTGMLRGSGLSDPKVWQEAQKEAAAGNPTKMHNLEDTTWKLYQIDPSLFGNMSPLLWKNQMLRGDMVEHTKGAFMLSHAQKEAGMIKAMNVAGATKQEIANFRHNVERLKQKDEFKSLKTYDQIMHEPIKERAKDLHTLNNFVTRERGIAEHALSQHEARTAGKAKVKLDHYTFGLTSEAAKLLKFLNKDQGSVSTSNSNSKLFSRGSSNKGSSNYLPPDSHRTWS